MTTASRTTKVQARARARASVRGAATLRAATVPISHVPYSSLLSNCIWVLESRLAVCASWLGEAAVARHVLRLEFKTELFYNKYITSIWPHVRI